MSLKETFSIKNVKKRLTTILSGHGLSHNNIKDSSHDNIEERFIAMLERHQNRATVGHSPLGTVARKHRNSIIISDLDSDGTRRVRTSKIALRYTDIEKSNMLWFDTLQFSTTLLGFIYFLLSIALTHVEEAYRAGGNAPNLLLVVITTFYVILSCLIVMATISIIFTFRYAKYSNTIFKLLMSLGRTWRIMFLLSLRLLFGFLACIYGAPFSSMLDGIAIFVLGLALIFQDILTIRYSHPILRIWVLSFTCVMFYTWIRSLINKEVNDISNPLIFNVRYNTYIRTIYSSLFGIMFDGLLIIIKDTDRKQFVWIIKRKFRSDLKEMNLESVENFSKFRKQYNTKQLVVILVSILALVFYILGADISNIYGIEPSTKATLHVLYYVFFIITFGSFLSLYSDNFSFDAMILLLKERHMFMSCLYCLSHLILYVYLYWPHTLGGFPSCTNKDCTIVIQNITGNSTVNTIVKEIGYGTFTDAEKVVNIIQSLVFLIQVLLFLSMDSLIVKSPFLVGMVAVLGGITMLQSAIGAGFLWNTCYLIPGLTVTQCSLELSIYTSLCFLFSASIYTAIRDRKFKRFLFIHEAVYCQTMTNSHNRRNTSMLNATSVQNMKRLSAMEEWIGNLDDIELEVPVEEEVII